MERLTIRGTVAVLIILIPLILLPRAAGAQSATTGAIAGAVRDATGAVLPGVTVEAASPALIEKVRAVFTDGQGQYRIVDLRPGAYTVTFTLPGFSAVRREGLELNVGVTLPVNAELRVGSVEETITVTGASPIVDVQNVRGQNVLTREVLDTLPVAKNFQSLAAITPGVSVSSGSAYDVGGTKGETYSGLQTHGSAAGLTLMDGMRTNTATNFASNTRYQANQLAVEEMVLETVAGMAENLSGGVNVNIVPKYGGNTLAGTFVGEYASSGMQSNNLTDALRARGLANTSRLRRVHDVGVGLGGAIKRDTLWFYTAHRNWGGLEEAPGIYHNKLQGTLFYEPDLSRPGLHDNYARDNNVRMTWQATSKQKLSAFAGLQDWCLCPLSYAFAPEAAYGYRFHPNNLVQATWSYPATSRLLVDAGWTLRKEHHLVEKINDAGDAQAVIDQTLGAYGSVWSSSVDSRAVYGNHGDQGQWSTRFSVSYVTGSHNFKIGVQTLKGGNHIGGPNVANNHPVQYIFQNQTPIGLNQAAYPHHHESRLKMDLGLYAQDQWTHKNLTLNLGLRFDWLNGYNPAQCRPAGDFTPEFCFDALNDVPNWKDISPRLGAAYNLFGNGKTALKASVGRYLKPAATQVTNATNPAAAIAAGTTRTWDDTNGNFIPDCDLKNRARNGECGAMANQLFGSVRPQTAWSSDATEGWHVRNHNWQGSVSVQHELRPGIGLTAGYFRTAWGNGGTEGYPGGGIGGFVTDNLAVTPADFDHFCITAPSDPRLPGGGGYRVCGLYDVALAKFGQVNNLVDHADKFGKRTYVYNGADASLNARFARGGMLYGGVSLGRTAVDQCASPDTPAQFCAYTKPFKADLEFKISGAYPLPLGLRVSATFVNAPGLPISATYAAPNALIVPSLGRNLAQCGTAAVCRATRSVQLIEPFSQFEDRLTKVDIRLSRTTRLGRVRLQPRVDLYNVFNTNTILGRNNTLGPVYGRPSQILGARMVKFGAQVDF